MNFTIRFLIIRIRRKEGPKIEWTETSGQVMCNRVSATNCQGDPPEARTVRCLTIQQPGPCAGHLNLSNAARGKHRKIGRMQATGRKAFSGPSRKSSRETAKSFTVLRGRHFRFFCIFFLKIRPTIPCVSKPRQLSQQSDKFLEKFC